MKTLFDIGNKEEGSRLYCELGPDYCCLATTDENKRFLSVRYYDAFDHQSIRSQLNSRAFEKMVIQSSFPEALVIPRKLYDEGKSAHWMEEVYHVDRKEQLTTSINEWQVVLQYTMPLFLQHAVPNFEPTHIYACELRSGFIAESQLNIHFSPRYFRVVGKNGKGLQLCQTYPYQTPLDVVYYLLQVCQQFGFNQETTHLSLSGLIEKDSHLYRELYQYFTLLSFAGIKGDPGLFADHPADYFHSIYQLALCAS